jgi:predicted nucleic acid-binding protein
VGGRARILYFNAHQKRKFALMRIMLDTNIFDRLVADDATLAAVLAAITAGQLTIVSTHIQRDQLQAIPDSVKRDKVLAIPVDEVPTTGMIWDVSKWGEGAWGDGATNHLLEKLIAGNARHAPDALIGATAAAHVTVLVTEDGQFSKRVARTTPRLEVVNYNEFVAMLSGMTSMP